MIQNTVEKMGEKEVMHMIKEYGRMTCIPLFEVNYGVRF